MIFRFTVSAEPAPNPAAVKPAQFAFTRLLFDVCYRSSSKR
jgi:hypothetical protein